MAKRGMKLGKLSKIIAKWRGFFPQALPRGGADFEAFANSIFELYDIPNNETYVNAIATMVLHLSPTTSHKSKYFFVRSVRKAMANQVAFDVIDAIRQKAKQAEVELISSKALDDQSKSQTATS